SKIASAFDGDPSNAWSHMYTYSAHPGGAAAALKNLEILEKEDLITNAKDRGKQLFERLEEIKNKSRIVGENRGVGLLQGLELVKDKESKEHFDSSLKINQILTQKLKDRGIWIRVPAFIIPISPPLTVTSGEIEHICLSVEESLKELEKELA
ncbi:MAG: hypothetical protein CL738_05355, partial [Chloroflexi bacterium]|nr:hypothetical protein [Chloroflexota bacterium]